MSTLFLAHEIKLCNIRGYCRARKFGGKLNFAIWQLTAKLKSARISYSHICMARILPLVWQCRSKPPNLNSPIFVMVIILGQTAKFSCCQYFWLYGI